MGVQAWPHSGSTTRGKLTFVPLIPHLKRGSGIALLHGVVVKVECTRDSLQEDLACTEGSPHTRSHHCRYCTHTACMVELGSQNVQSQKRPKRKSHKYNSKGRKRSRAEQKRKGYCQRSQEVHSFQRKEKSARWRLETGSKPSSENVDWIWEEVTGCFNKSCFNRMVPKLF